MCCYVRIDVLELWHNCSSDVSQISVIYVKGWRGVILKRAKAFAGHRHDGTKHAIICNWFSTPR